MAEEEVKTLCNIDDIFSICDGADLNFDEQKEKCDAAVKASYRNCCMYLCPISNHCGSWVAAETAKLNKK